MGDALVGIGGAFLAAGVFGRLGRRVGLDDRIDPFVALYVLVLAVAGPLLTAHSRHIADRLPDRLLPAPPIP